VDPQVVEALRERLPWITDLAVYFGPPRANAKPVLALLKGDEVAAVAKLGTTPLTRELVAREHEALIDEGRRHHVRYKAPQVLDSFCVADCQVLVLTAFDLRGSKPIPLTGAGRLEWIEVAREIACPRPSSVLTQTAWWRSIQTGLDSLSGVHGGQQVGYVAETLAAAAGARVMPAASHGDFTQWNARRLERTWAVWDWERYTEDSIWGFDVLHWELFAHARGGLPRACDWVLREHGRILSGTGIGTTESGLMAFLYFADLAVRFGMDRQRAAHVILDAAVRAAEVVRRG
jgi:hypothetical protein